MTACALCACGQATTAVAPPPLSGEIESLVLGVQNARGFELYAGRVRSGVADPIVLGAAFEPRSTVGLEALRYAETLEELGLGEGLVESFTGSAAAPLPDPAAPLLRADLVVGNDPPGWEESDRRSAELAAFRVVPPPSRCVDFRIRVRAVPDPAIVVLAGEAQPGRVLIGTLQGRFFVMDAESIEPVEANGAQVYRALHRLDDGTLLLGSEFGSLRRARLEDRLVLGEDTEQTAPGILWISGSTDPHEIDVFTMSVDGVVGHYDGVRHRVVHRSVGAVSELFAGGVARVGPYEAIVAWPTDRGVTRVRREASGEGSVIAETTPGATAAFLTASHHPSLGGILGNSDGQIFSELGGAWGPLPDAPLRVFIYGIASYEDGFLYGAAFGNVGQYTISDGFCPILPTVLGDDVRRIHALSTGAVVVTGRQIAQQPQVGWLDPR